MAHTITLPGVDGSLFPYTVGPASSFPLESRPALKRRAFAAAHVVANPLVDTAQPGASIDWDATLAYRRHLWKLGFSVAEAMDTAQRGMGLNWDATQELIRLSLAEARKIDNAGIACGAGTDHLVPAPGVTLDEVKAAYETQCSFIEQEGGQIILMASRALAACAQSPDDYVKVYDHILSQVSRPVILHWLGDMFDPALTGYWGSKDLDVAMTVCLDIIARNKEKVDGIKISLLDKQKEIVMRRLLPEGVRMYTGDDFNYPELIYGDEQGYSHALLGIFDGIAPAAAAALHALDQDNKAEYDRILSPTVPLSRHIFKAPTYYYKTGIVFLSYLNGHQSHFRMVAGLESARSIIHLAELFILADKACLLVDPELAVARMKNVLALAGIV